MGKKLLVFGRNDENNSGWGGEFTLRPLSFSLWIRRAAIEFRDLFDFEKESP